MRNADLIWLPAVLIVFAGATTGWIRIVAIKKGLMDLPTGRSSHVKPTPRGGGLAVVASFLLVVIWAGVSGAWNREVLIALSVGGGSVAFVGFMDDRRSLPASLRFCVHFLSASWVVGTLGRIPSIDLDAFGAYAVWLERLFILTGIVWATNLFNFMDGIDGIAGSEAVFFAAAGGGLNWILGGDVSVTLALFSLAAACSGFLLWNWPPAKIFMGDVGSSFLGFILASIALIACKSGKISIEPWIILGGSFFTDASVTLIRRMIRGDRWSEAHRMHAYQRLARLWQGHRPVTLLFAIINIFWLLPWASFAAIRPEYGIRCLVVSLLPLVVVAIVAGAGRVEEHG